MTLPYARGWDTSKTAAESMEARAPQLRERILSVVRTCGGLTCDEVEVVLGLPHQTASARINELLNEGRLVDTGKRRETRSGRQAAVCAPPTGAPIPIEKVKVSPKPSAEVLRKAAEAVHRLGLDNGDALAEVGTWLSAGGPCPRCANKGRKL